MLEKSMVYISYLQTLSQRNIEFIYVRAGKEIAREIQRWNTKADGIKIRSIRSVRQAQS